MNKFKDLIGVLRDRADADELVKKVISDLETLETLDRVNRDERRAQEFRLPYSSDPKPIEEAWSN
jgi:hypothetical protein